MIRAIIMTTIEIEDYDFYNILLAEKLYETFFIHDISYKFLISAKSLGIRFDKVDEFIRVYDAGRCLVLLGPKNYDAVCNRISYLAGVKSSIIHVIFHNYTRTKINSHDSLH